MAGFIRAEIVLDWELDDLQCEHLLQRVTSDPTDPTSIRFFRGVRYVVNRSRRVAKVIGFSESCGDKLGGFTLATGADTTMVWASTKRIFVCTQDRLSPTDKLANECVQSQVWQTEGDWEEITEDIFKLAE